MGSRRASPRLLLVLSTLIVLIALIPVVFVAGYVVSTGWAEAVALIWRPRVGELLRNTALLVSGCVGLTAVLGTGTAWLVERTTLPGRRVWNVLLVAPLAVPAFVNSFGWVSLTDTVQGYAGALLIVSLSYFPWSICRLPRCCAVWTPPWRRRPQLLATASGGLSPGWCCPSFARICWAGP